MTKIQQAINTCKNLPAGIIPGTGIEYFNPSQNKFSKGRFIQAGETLEWEELKFADQKVFLTDYDKQATHRSLIYSHFTQDYDLGFWVWMNCTKGAMDTIPDAINGKVQDIEYNNICTRKDCPIRGKLCGLPFNLKPLEVETIKLIQQGFNSKEICDKMCISRPGLNSRKVSIYDKLGANNMAQASFIAAQAGII